MLKWGYFDRLAITPKLMVIVMVPTVLALLLACIILFVFDVTFFRESLKNEISQNAIMVSDRMAEPLREGREGGAQDALHMLQHNPRILRACVYDVHGDVFARYFKNGETHIDGKLIEFPKTPSARGQFTWNDGTFETYHQIVEPSGIVGTLYILADASALMVYVPIYSLAVLLVVVMSALGAFLLAQRLQTAVSKPIENLALLARIVSDEKDYSVRAVKKNDDEIGKLVDEFNEMLEQIESQQAELRTIQGTLEVRVEKRTHELSEEVTEHKRTAQNLKQEIHVRKKAEKELTNAMREVEEASRFKGEFLANMSHEIRTPMNGIIGMTELMLNTSLTPAQLKYAQTIRRSGRSLLKIIGDVLDFSKVEAGQLTIEPIPFDMQLAVEDVVELLSAGAEEKGLSLIMRYAPNAPHRLVGDVGRIRQIITNLLSNAIKFTREGYVLVNVECAGVTNDRAVIRVVVEDTGIGAPQDKLDLIFQKYAQADVTVQRHYGGTGLGLTICKQLVELMGGTIGVQSREGVGSRFHFSLVLPVAQEVAPTPRLREHLAGVRVLIADHSSINQRILFEQVNAWQMRATAVGSSTQALEELKRAHADNDPYSVVLIDDQMPAIHGESLGRTIKQLETFQDTLLVLLTSIGQRGDAARMTELGFAAYLSRPVRQSELMDALATLWAAHLRGETLDLVTRHSIAESRDERRDEDERPVVNLGGRILVAEDNFVNQQVALEILQGFGCVVSLANDGAEAVDHVQNLEYDLVFMDCQMPRMSGFDATREIRKLEGDGKHIPIVAMTAHALRGDREKCLDAGMDDYVSKPVDPEILLRVLHRWLPESARAGVTAREETAAVSGDPDGTPLVFDIHQALWITGGKTAMFQRIVKVFLQHMPERIRELDSAVKIGDFQEISRLAHSIKGASSSIAGMQLHEVANELEEIAKLEDTADIQLHHEALKSAFELLRDHLAGIDWQALEENVAAGAFARG